MRKIFAVALGTANGVYTELTLPATPYVMLDALEKLRLEEGEVPRWELLESYDALHLFHHLDQNNGSLEEANALAQRLADLDNTELAIVGGLAAMEQKPLGEPFPLSRLIDLAYSTDCCHLVKGVVTDAQLGRFCAENGFVPALDGLPDEVFDLLDFERIGREHRQSEGGVLVERTTGHPGGYVERHDELRQVYKTMNLSPQKPPYTILAETFSGDKIEFPFPPNAPMGTELVRCVDCAAPSLIGLTVGMESMDLLARRLAGMEPQELTAYKALLEAADCKDLSDAGLLADSLYKYIFTPSLNSPEEVAEEELGVILCEESIPQLIPYVDLRGYGQALIEQRGSVLTPYGLLEREDGQPIHSMNEQPEPGGMEMRF